MRKRHTGHGGGGVHANSLPPRANSLYKVGDIVEVLHSNGAWMDARVTAVHHDGTCDIECSDGVMKRMTLHLQASTMRRPKPGFNPYDSGPSHIDTTMGGPKPGFNPYDSGPSDTEAMRGRPKSGFNPYDSDFVREENLSASSGTSSTTTVTPYHSLIHR